MDVTQHGVAVNSGTNQSANIQALVASNTTLFFPAGTYTLTNFVNLAGISNLTISGETGTILTTSINKVFNISGAFTNLEIFNIQFISTKSSTINDTEGLIFFGNYGSSDVEDNIQIHDCIFNSLNTKCNAIKVISEGTNSLIKNVSIYKNEFNGIGRMGVEFQNNLGDSTFRYRDFWVNNNYFNNIGTIHSGVSICAISLSGPCYNGHLDFNIIIDVNTNTTWALPNYGIENAGCINLTSIGNTMQSINYPFTGFLGSGPSVDKSGWIIKGNILDLKGGTNDNFARGMEMNGLINAVISENYFHTDGYSIFFVDSCTDNIVSSNLLRLNVNNRAIYVQSGSTRNHFNLNNVNAGSTTGGDANIYFDGASVTGNFCFNNTLIGSGGAVGYINQINGATKNTYAGSDVEPITFYQPNNFQYALKVGNYTNGWLKMGGFGNNIESWDTTETTNVNLNLVAPTVATSAALQVGTNLILTLGGKISIAEGTNGKTGQISLVAGKKVITISGLTTTSRAFLTLVTPASSSSTTSYKAVCTSGTLTIQANIAAGTINTADVSTLNYLIIN